MADEETNLDDENVTEETEQHDDKPEAISVEEFNKLKEEKEKIASYLEKANKEAKNYRLKAKDYEELGMSPEEIREIKEQQQKQQQKELEKKGEWDKLKAQLQEDFNHKLTEKEQETERLRSLMERNFVGREVESAISKHDGISTLLKPHVESSVQLVEEDGNFVARVVDKDGSPKFNSQGDYMSVEEFVAGLKEDEDFGLAFRGRNQSGGGSKSSNSSGNPPKPKKKRGDMDMDEKRQYITKYGVDEYEKLPL